MSRVRRRRCWHGRDLHYPNSLLTVERPAPAKPDTVELCPLCAQQAVRMSEYGGSSDVYRGVVVASARQQLDRYLEVAEATPEGARSWMQREVLKHAERHAASQEDAARRRAHRSLSELGQLEPRLEEALRVMGARGTPHVNITGSDAPDDGPLAGTVFLSMHAIVTPDVARRVVELIEAETRLA